MSKSNCKDYSHSITIHLSILLYPNQIQFQVTIHKAEGMQKHFAMDHTFCRCHMPVTNLKFKWFMTTIFEFYTHSDQVTMGIRLNKILIKIYFE